MIAASAEDIFAFLTDLTNLDPLIPHDRVKNWHSEPESCSFSAPPAGDITLKITGKEPHHLIKVEPEGSTPIGFRFYIQLKEVAENDTRFKLTVKAELNAFMKGMIKPQLQKGLDQIVDTLSGMEIPKPG